MLNYIIGLRFETKTSSQDSGDNEDGSKPAKRSKSMVQVTEKSNVDLTDEERKLLEDNRMLTLVGKAKKFTQVFPQYHVYYMNYE